METTTTELTKEQITRAATNAPSLSPDQVKLGIETFTIVDLPFDDYLVFLSHMTPLLEAVSAKVLSMKGISLPTTSTEFSPALMMQYCSKSLPEMARLVLSQTEPSITVDDIKKKAKSPFEVASVVLKQVQHNNMIADITDFFVQVLPLIAVAGRTVTQ